MARPDLGPLGPPPADFSDRELPAVSWRAPLVRVHRHDHDPAFLGRTGLNRFDAPGSEFGVLYAAEDLQGAFIETFGDAAGRTVTVNSLTVRAYTTFEPTRALSLVDVRGAGLARIGADARLFAGDRVPAQQWSLAIWSHPATVDGICYRARHDPSRSAVALYDRADRAVRVAQTTPLMAPSERPAFAAVLDAYSFGLIDA